MGLRDWEDKEAGTSHYCGQLFHSLVNGRDISQLNSFINVSFVENESFLLKWLAHAVACFL